MLSLLPVSLSTTCCPAVSLFLGVRLGYKKTYTPNPTPELSGHIFFTGELWAVSNLR